MGCTTSNEVIHRYIQMLIKKSETCTRLSLTADGLRKLQLKDPTFPKPIKLGSSKQAPVFFDIKELEQWLELKKAERAGEFEA